MASTSANVEGHGRISPFKLAPFLAVHLIAVFGVIASGWSWKGFALAIALYYVRMFGVTGGYHRYFSHRTYRTSRAFQFVLALARAVERPEGRALVGRASPRPPQVLGHPADPHSAATTASGTRTSAGSSRARPRTPTEQASRDLARYPELRWLNNVPRRPGRRRSPSASSSSAAGPRSSGASSSRRRCSGTARSRSTRSRTCSGRRRYTTTDDSKNNLVLALVTMGEGWHNNHHYYPRSATRASSGGRST